MTFLKCSITGRNGEASVIPSLQKSMEKQPDNTTLIEHQVYAALEYRKFGLRVLPLRFGTKEAAVRWKRYQTEDPTEREIVQWFSETANIAILTGRGLVVVDVDDPAILEAVLEQCGGPTPMTCKTPRGGFHCYFRTEEGGRYGNSVKIGGKGIDVRGEGGYCVCPWSRTETGGYFWTG